MLAWLEYVIPCVSGLRREIIDESEIRTNSRVYGEKQYEKNYVGYEGKLEVIASSLALHEIHADLCVKRLAR